MDQTHEQRVNDEQSVVCRTGRRRRLTIRGYFDRFSTTAKGASAAVAPAPRKRHLAAPRLLGYVDPSRPAGKLVILGPRRGVRLPSRSVINSAWKG
jgi:hypothetical protein